MNLMHAEWAESEAHLKSLNDSSGVSIEQFRVLAYRPRLLAVVHIQVCLIWPNTACKMLNSLCCMAPTDHAGHGTTSPGCEWRKTILQLQALWLTTCACSVLCNTNALHLTILNSLFYLFEVFLSRQHSHPAIQIEIEMQVFTKSLLFDIFV